MKELFIYLHVYSVFSYLLAAKMSQVGSTDNGNIKQALGKQEQKLHEVEDKLTGCVSSLKESVTNTLRKAKRWQVTWPNKIANQNP